MSGGGIIPGITGNLDGYICLPVVHFLGSFGNNYDALGCTGSCSGIPDDPADSGHLLMWILTGVLVLDITATICILSGRSRRIRQWEGVDSWLTGVSSRLERNIYRWVDYRIRNAYPGGGVPGGASGGGRAEKDDLRLWTMLL